MTKTIKICDKCNKEVRWLYHVPRIQIVGYTLEISEGNRAELCETCMHKLINIIDEFHKTEEHPTKEEI
jgi:hypothetical protein